MILQQNFNCDKNIILSSGGQIIENQDGSITVYELNNLNVLEPVQIGSQCCTNLGYIFDVEKQKCFWSLINCDINNEYKIVLNPNGNDGTIFEQNFNETCSLNIKFDYLIKLKCETLMGSLIEESQDMSVINAIIEQKQAQETTYQALNNQLEILLEQIDSTRYSIICDTSPLPTQQNVSNSLFSDVFANSAFNQSSEVSTTINSSTIDQDIIGKIYCISEPSGLNAWYNILSQVNYDAFINGDPYSYTCHDVQLLVDANDTAIAEDPNTPPFIYECTTQFGTKTQLLIELADLNSEIAASQAILDGLDEQINNLSSTGVDICNRPLSLFETMSLRLVVDTVDANNVINTVYIDDNLFPEIGVGNLYNYITNKENTGFYVCGGDECTPLILDSTEDNQLTCNMVVENILNDLYFESGLSALTNGLTQFNESFSKSALTSNWLSYSTTISDPETIALILIQNQVRYHRNNHWCM